MEDPINTVLPSNYVGTLYDPIYQGSSKRSRRGGMDELTIFQIGNLQIGEMVRIFVLQIEVIINFILDLFAAMILFAFKILSLLTPYFLYFLLFVFLYWMAHVAFPYTMKLIVLFGIPLLDMLIIAFNIIFKIVVFIYMILATIWNAVVPFLGMLLSFVFDIVFTIMDAVNQILGAIDLGSLFNDLMPLINIIMELVLQIVQVIIQVGEPVLSALLKIIVPLIEAIFSVIKVLLPILTFLVKVVFFVLQPIIWLLQAFFGGGQSQSYGEETSGAARKLLSVNFFGNTRAQDVYAGYEPYAKTIMTTLNMTAGEFYTSLYNNKTEVEPPDLWSTPQMTGRQPLAYTPRKAGLSFMDIDEEEDEEEEEEGRSMYGRQRTINLNSGPSKHDDDMTYNFVHTFYKSSKTIPKQTMEETFSIMDSIMEHYRNVDPLTISAIYANYNRENGHIHLNPDERLGSVRYAAAIEHPNDLNERLTQERAAKRAELWNSQLAGRKLLDMTVFPENANEHLNHYMSNLERQHAMQVMEQAKVYKEKHEERMKLASVVTGAVSATMKRHAETTFHPNNIRDQCNAFLQTLGYNDIWEWHAQISQEFATGEEYVLSFAQYFDNPLFNFFKSIDVGEDDVLYFKDWESEQKRSFSDGISEMPGSGRKLFSVDEDNNVGTSKSRVALSGFATVSKRNCNTNPKHALCAPIPPNSIYKWEIPLLILTQKQKDDLLQDTSDCSPWINEVYCLICWERVYNAGVEIVFLFSAIPQFNNAIAGVTRVIPWTGVFLNWIFIVPKFKRASTLQWLCFSKETFSLFITITAIVLCYSLLWPFLQAPYKALTAIIKIRARPPKSSKTIEMLDNNYRMAFDNPEIHPPRGLTNIDSVLVAGRIGGKDTHLHHHHYYNNSAETSLFISFLQQYAKNERRASDRLEKLLTYLGLYKYNLHVQHPDYIDTDAVENENNYITHQNHPVHKFIEYKGPTSI